MQLTSNKKFSEFDKLSNMFCPNKDCKDHNISDHDNISIRCNYITNKDFRFIVGHMVNVLQ